MAVYVDRSVHRLGRMKTCHMIADTLDELHAMAEAIGCDPSWFQVSRSGVPHYDIPLFRKERAIARGAVVSGTRDFAAVMRKIKIRVTA